MVQRKIWIANEINLIDYKLRLIILSWKIVLDFPEDLLSQAVAMPVEVFYYTSNYNALSRWPNFRLTTSIKQI